MHAAVVKGTRWADGSWQAKSRLDAPKGSTQEGRRTAHRGTMKWGERLQHGVVSRKMSATLIFSGSHACTPMDLLQTGWAAAPADAPRSKRIPLPRLRLQPTHRKGGAVSSIAARATPRPRCRDGWWRCSGTRIETQRGFAQSATPPLMIVSIGPSRCRCDHSSSDDAFAPTGADHLCHGPRVPTVARAHGHEKIPICGQVDVPACGQVKVPTPL